MDQKNALALTLGVEHLLGKFANLSPSPDHAKSAAAFHEQYGELYPGLSPRHYWKHVHIFRNIWKWKTAEKFAPLDAGAYIRNIFNRELAGMPELNDSADPRFRPALVVEFAEGKISVRPETLLDVLALGLLVHRNDLALCEHPGCAHPYFVRTHARQRFCSHECANWVREQKKKEWWEENRGKFIAKWKEQRKSRKKQLTKGASRKGNIHGSRKTR